MADREEFFLKVEEITKICIPVYIQKLLWYSGFDNIFSFLQFDKIDDLENFAREDLFEIADDEEISNIYNSVYKLTSALKIQQRKFNILLGHKKLLLLLIDKFKNRKEIESAFLKKSLDQNSKKRQRECICICSCGINDVSLPRSTQKRRRDSTETEHATTGSGAMIDVDLNSEENKVIKHVKRLTMDYAKKVISLKISDKNIKKELLDTVKNIYIEQEESGVLSIKCFMRDCETKCRITSKPLKNGGVNWVTSNFNRHLTQVHFNDKNSASISKGTLEATPIMNSMLKYLTCENPKENPEGSRDIILVQNLKAQLNVPQRVPLNTAENEIIEIYSETTSSSPRYNLEQDLEGSLCDIQNNDVDEDVGNNFNTVVVHSDSHYECLQPELQPDIEPTLSVNTAVNTAETDLRLASVTNVAASIQPIDTNNEYEGKSRGESEGKPFFGQCGSVNPTSTPATSQAVQITSKWKQDRYSRRQRKLRQLQVFRDNQLAITDFPDFIFKLKYQVKYHFQQFKSEKVTSSSSSIICEDIDRINDNETEFTNLLDLLLDAYKNNTGKNKFASHFDFEIKRIALFIFINAGRYLYEILHANMKGALPSLSTLYRMLNKSPKLEEGQLRFGELKSFLIRRNLPLRIFISEDQTAIVKRVEYDPETNKMVGFVTSLNSKTGLPEESNFKVNSVRDIEDAFKNGILSQNCYVIIAQPLSDAAPSFCLALFGSDNKFTTESILNRWEFLKTEGKKNGIKVEGYATDGDPRCLKAMKVVTKIPFRAQKNIYSPFFQVDFNLDIPVVIQDSVHICTKLKTRLTKPDVFLPMGTTQVSTTHLQEIMNTISKDQHLISPTYLDNADKMNFKSIEKLCSYKVINLLPKIPESAGTRQYLLMCRYIIEVFLNKSTDIKDRIYYIWYTVFFLRVWRQWLYENGYSIMSNFITSNAYTCIEINAHGLLLLIEKCRKDNTPELFLPWLYSSQPCESTFRQIRSMTTTNSTVVNFSLNGMMKRLNRVQVLNDFATDFRDKLHFPREEGRLGLGKQILTDIPDVEEIKNLIKKSKIDAARDAEALGMNLKNMELAFEKINIQPVFDETENDDENEPVEIANRVTNSKVGNLQDSDDNHETNEYLSESELEEISKDISLFSKFNELKLKDYSDKTAQSTKTSTTSSTTPYLKVMLNDNKIVTVRKSSLCWYFSDSTGRLSSDRLLRVRGMSKNKDCISKQKTTRKTRTKRKEKLPETSSESDASSDASYSEKSKFEDEVFSDNSDILGDIQKSETRDICIENEKYYCVYYDSRWYVGRVIAIEKSNVKVKFLEEFLGMYKWPKKDDIQEVMKDFLFYGPIQFGSYPFQLTRAELCKIKKIYRTLKK